VADDELEKLFHGLSVAAARGLSRTDAAVSF
jgi:hypothetical protein